MTTILRGIGVSKGIAIGRVRIIKRDQLDIRRYHIDKRQINKEIKRYEDALRKARRQLEAIRKQLPRAKRNIAAFIDTHLLMLKDTAFSKRPLRLIKQLSCNAEWALKLQHDSLATTFDVMDDSYLRARKNDIDYVVNLIQRILLKHMPLQYKNADKNLQHCILLTDDLTPADTLLIQHHGIAAFATSSGGPTSHTAILARSLNIPAIVNLRDILKYAKDEDDIILDGNRGTVLINASTEELHNYRQLQKEHESYFVELGKLKEEPCVTLDGTAIALYANIELPGDFETVVAVGAQGVGLYRTEYLYMNREAPPDEEEHFTAYTKVVKILDGLPLTIRTLDLGADKQVDGGDPNKAVTTNPALGLRAIRLCLKEPGLLRPQLRAIIRASAYGTVRIVLPMLSNIHELEQILQMIKDIKKEFDAHNITYDRELKVGGIIEVPAAAICADIFAKRLDFLSLGTNDLIQYTIAIDRVNNEVNYLYEPLHPAVLRLIHGTIEAGRRHNIGISMCGEMAGQTEYTQLLLGLGLREFSLHPNTLLETKKIIMENDIQYLQKLATKALNADSGAEVSAIMRQT